MCDLKTASTLTPERSKRDARIEGSRIKSDEHLERGTHAGNIVKQGKTKRKRQRSSSSLRSSSSRERKKMKKKKNKHSRSSSSDSSSSTSSSSSSPSRGRKQTKKRKHKHSRSSSSFSDSSSSRERKKKKKKHKHKNKKKEKEKKKLMSDTAISPNLEQAKNSVAIGPQVSVATMAAKGVKKSKSKAMRPMTKEEWEKQQSVVRRVYDPQTGRNRLVKGDGEILEEIVNKEQHREINKQATRGDGLHFQTKMGIRDK